MNSGLKGKIALMSAVTGALVAGLTARAGTAGASGSYSDWPMFRADPGHSGVSPETAIGTATAGTLTAGWTARLGTSSGYDQGYEEIPFPGLYDPRTSGDVSPLLNAFEAGAVVGSPGPMVDAFRVDMAPEPRAVKLLTALADTCDRTQDPDTVRGALDELSWSLLDCALRAAPRRALLRSAAMAHRHDGALGDDHRRVLKAIKDHAGSGPEAGLPA